MCRSFYLIYGQKPPHVKRFISHETAFISYENVFSSQEFAIFSQENVKRSDVIAIVSDVFGRKRQKCLTLPM